MSLRGDERGLGVGFVLFFAALAIGALLFVMFNPVMTSVNDQVSDQTDDPDAQATIDERQQIWDALLYWVVFVAGVFVIARAVFEGRGP